VLELTAVGLIRGGRRILDRVEWRVEPGQHWVVLGPNGSGKTTLMSLASAYAHPSEGTVSILGCQLGRVDVRSLRRRLAVTGADLAKRLRPEQAAIDVVLAGRHAALETWWDDYTDQDRKRAFELMDAGGVAHLGDRPLRTLSEGERQQLLLARALMGDPELLVLDEPNAGLDLTARENLLGRLAELASDPDTPPMILVTHHVEEIPPGFTHALLLRSGQVAASGSLDTTLRSDALSEVFSLPLRLIRHGDRYSCHAVWPS
jgi:iron complex transport system ATP-binding protein